jgi:hypothetical protein
LLERAAVPRLKRRARLQIFADDSSSDDGEESFVDVDEAVGVSADVTWKLRRPMRWPPDAVKALKQAFVVANLVQNAIGMQARERDQEV